MSNKNTTNQPGSSTQHVLGTNNPPNPPSNMGTKSTLELKHRGKETLGKLKAFFQAAPVAAGTFSPLKTAMNELVNVFDVVEAVAENQECYEELYSEFQSIFDSLQPYADKLDTEARNSSVARIVQSINAQIAHIKKRQEQGKTKQMFGFRENQGDLIKRYRQVASLFRQLQNDINLRIWNNTDRQLSEMQLKGMSPVRNAIHDSSFSRTVNRRGCTRGTREQVLETLRNWVQNPHSAKLFWMSGMLGTGKTTIAYSLCEWLKDEKQLGASFFCSRGSDTCRDLNGIVPTIAYQLARYSPAFRWSLSHALEDDPDAPIRNVSAQFNKLIVEPVARVRTALPEGVTVVIDALDECDNHGLELLELLLKHAIDLPIKFFITVRPEPVIYKTMMTVARPMDLDGITSPMVEDDVYKYLAEALGNMLRPPTDDQLRQLARQSGKLFAYASILVLYVNPSTPYVDSSRRLQTVLLQENDHCGKSAGPSKLFIPLDRLYDNVLGRAFDDKLELEELQNVQNVLWTIICGGEPLSIEILAELLQLTNDQVFLALKPLHSVLHVPEGGGLVTPVHASFSEYLLDKSRSGQMHCDGPRQNERLAHRCFDLMITKLFGPGTLELSSPFYSTTPDSKEQVNVKISPSVLYAGRYLDTHLHANPTSNLHASLNEISCGGIPASWMRVLEALDLKSSTMKALYTSGIAMSQQPPPPSYSTPSPLLRSLYGCPAIACT
ncbi:unnamed protein product [Rhizoctonia solani]|nr:unnamed protein product [Rhizoctonia solani]